VLQQVKLIAEPWDLGAGGYQVGNFPPLWSEWNGKFRDTVRDFWRGQDRTLGEFANRFTGSSDLYEATGRRPYASINFVTCHDGFTLRDLVSYAHKHNTANGEENRDGEEYNRSWNCGVEGETDDPSILACRSKQQRNFLAALFLAQGVPMLLAGDEMGRTQRGNNNAYCQDNEISWLDWTAADSELLQWTRQIIALRRAHPVFRRRRFFQGRSIRGSGWQDVGWFKPDGMEMSDEDWRVVFAKSIGVFLNGEGIESRDLRGYRVRDADFYVIWNAHDDNLVFTIPLALGGASWHQVFDTASTRFDDGTTTIAPGAQLTVTARSVRLMRRPQGNAESKQTGFVP
jgi:glycogen operon protein